VTIETKFKEYCQQQISLKIQGWDIQKTLAWRNDHNLLKKVNNLKITKRQASFWWLRLRTDVLFGAAVDRRSKPGLAGFSKKKRVLEVVYSI
jgi:hypothetical protein